MATQKAFAITAFEDRLSRFVSNHPGLCRMLGNLETKRFVDEIESRIIDRPIYVTGLARSGSTILLECLAAHEQTAAHCYRDYPLVCTPLWWNRLVDRSGPVGAEPVERFHQDGIYITPDSPEAMEEILWMMFFPDCHLSSRSNVIGPETDCPAFEKFYPDHVRKILFLRRGSRYLAKANYHVTRLEYLQRIFPDARFVIPVRDPIHHVASLSRQHRLFCAEEDKDRRVLNYMRVAGHFEFGLDRRPINTGCSKTVDRIRKSWKEGKEALGLALTWQSVYRYVIARLTANDNLRAATLIVDHDDFRRSPEDNLARIYDHCGLAVDKDFLANQSQKIFPVREGNPSFFSKADLDVIVAETLDVYEEIRSITP